MVEQCAHACVVSAQKTISIISEHESVGRSITLLPAWWYRVYYIGIFRGYYPPGCRTPC
ncbi:hypothetical protein F4814DRAFT_407473 [Daldinia grandis]|nr:hypothetical protein F4814DRAFT_407473 [Daldinia grandis]